MLPRLGWLHGRSGNLTPHIALDSLTATKNTTTVLLCCCKGEKRIVLQTVWKNIFTGSIWNWELWSGRWLCWPEDDVTQSHSSICNQEQTVGITRLTNSCHVLHPDGVMHLLSHVNRKCCKLILGLKVTDDSPDVATSGARQVNGLGFGEGAHHASQVPEGIPADAHQPELPDAEHSAVKRLPVISTRLYLVFGNRKLQRKRTFTFINFLSLSIPITAITLRYSYGLQIGIQPFPPV